MPQQNTTRTYERCRICSQPIWNEGRGWYHQRQDMGSPGRFPHFAEPQAVSA